MSMGRILSICAVCAFSFAAAQNDAQPPLQSATEKALAAGLKPLRQIDICPPLFDGEFGTNPVVPSRQDLMGIVEAKLKAGSVLYSLQAQHNEALVDKHILEERKTTAWMHLRFQVIALPDKTAYACRIVIQLQSPVTHPGDDKQYVFANLYEDSRLVLSTRDLTKDAITNAVSELFGRFADRWNLAHAPAAP